MKKPINLSLRNNYRIPQSEIDRRPLVARYRKDVVLNKLQGLRAKFFDRKLQRDHYDLVTHPDSKGVIDFLLRVYSPSIPQRIHKGLRAFGNSLRYKPSIPST